MCAYTRIHACAHHTHMRRHIFHLHTKAGFANILVAETQATRVPWPHCLPQISGIWAPGRCSERHLQLLLPALSCSEGYLYALEKVGEADCLANAKLRPWIWSPWVSRPPSESPQSWGPECFVLLLPGTFAGSPPGHPPALLYLACQVPTLAQPLHRHSAPAITNFLSSPCIPPP